MTFQQIFPAVFAIITGTGMLVLWTMLFASKQIPELATEPLRIGFHIAAEMVTALLLISGGISILLSWQVRTWLYPLSIGALTYTAIVSPGYYAQKGQWGFVWMFTAIILLAIISLLLFI